MFYIIVFIIGWLSESILDLITTVLNKINLFNTITNKKFDSDIFEESFLKKVHNYISDYFPLDIIETIFSLVFIFYLIFSGSLVKLSNILNNRFESPILSHLILLAIIGLIYFIFSLPLSVYKTFVLEKKYEFSTITVKLFIIDIIKGLLLSVILGGLLLSLIFYLIIKFENTWWIYAWIVSTLWSLLLLKLFPTFIAPLFNKFTPIEEGELKSIIMEYAKKANFNLTNIFKCDASKRSKHSNAYFTGIGKNKQVVLYDTLIEQLTNEELASVLLHEIGHYKKKHIWILFSIQTIITGLILFLIKEFIFLDNFIDAFNLSDSHYITRFIFSALFVQSFTWIINIPIVYFTRKNEFEADKYASDLSGKPEDLANSLIKLVKENLSNPYPHPLYSTLYCSHPKVTERVKRLKK